jgi:hypothetical protein
MGLLLKSGAIYEKTKVDRKNYVVGMLGGELKRPALRSRRIREVETESQYINHLINELNLEGAIRRRAFPPRNSWIVIY